jgi:hypothetical protein
MRPAAAAATLTGMHETAPQLLPVAVIALLGLLVYGVFAVLAILLG